jgi:DNA-binding Xre family transcriptional regulator
MVSNKDLNRLKVVLVEKKKSSLWLSRQLGCAPTTVSKWCTNSSQPPLEMLMKTAKLLEVDLNDLVRFEELEQKQDLKSNMD